MLKHSLGRTAFGVSADGSVIVGVGSGDPFYAWRWSTTGGVQPLRGVGNPYAVSADGSVAVGLGIPGYNMFQAVRWTSDGTMHELGLGATQSPQYAIGVNADLRTSCLPCQRTWPIT